MKNHPILIGILNGIWPGLGYLIIKERTVFAALLFISTVLWMLVLYFDPSPAFEPFLFAVTPLGRFAEGISYALMAIAFGYDAYELALKKTTLTVTP